MRRSLSLLAVTAALLVAGACGGDGPSAGDQRADQVRAAAREAGLPGEVADVLALASRGPTATFRISYPGTDGADLVVSQRSPDRRVDVLSGGQVVESRVARHGVAYRCDIDTKAKPGPKGSYDALKCTRAAGDLPATGAFTEEALATFTKELAASLDHLELTVTHRTLAKTEATCLVTAPKPGTVLTGNDPSADTLCVSAEGAQLLVDANGQRLVASTYTTTVPRSTFEIRSRTGGS